MARDFREMMAEKSPPWLLTVDGQPFMQAIGTVKDGMMWRARQAVMTRFPAYGTATAVALRGQERGIYRAVGESLSSYAGRVRGAWSSWLLAGTATGMLRALYDSGFTNAQLAIFNGRRYYLTPVTRALNEVDLGTHSWQFRTYEDTYWARFIVLFPNPLIQRWIDDGVPADDSDESNTIRSIIRKWKPAHMLCDQILIAEDEDAERTLGYFPPGETMGSRPGTLGDRVPWTSWTP